MGLGGRRLIYSLQTILMTSVVSAAYPTFTRSYSDYCLIQQKPDLLRSLTYADNSSHPVLIPYPEWTSARILGDIAYILLTEIMNYSTLLFDTTTLFDEQVVNYVAGCFDPDDPQCVLRDPDHPQAHFTLESWSLGASRANGLPDAVRPFLLSVLDYDLFDSWYLWSDVVQAGWDQGHLTLDYYRGYNASVFKPHAFFDPWSRMLDLLPPDVVIKCAARDPGNKNGMAWSTYVRVTGDNRTDCVRNGSVWLSPRCRANASECVPLMLQYSLDRALQLAFFLDLPLAIVLVGPGPGGAYSEYYAAVRRGRFLFGWYQPDDTLADAAGRLPVLVNLPSANELEQQQGIFRTGTAQTRPRNYVWRKLEEVRRRRNRRAPPPNNLSLALSVSVSLFHLNGNLSR